MEISLRSAKKNFIRLTILSILMFIVVGSASAGIDKSEPEGKEKLRTADDVEIRFEYSSSGVFADFSQYYSVFMVINQNGNARALRYGLRFQAKNVSAYEAVFPQAEVQQWFARVRAAFRLPKHRKDYDPHLVYHGDSFYLGLKSPNGKVKEMFGDLDTKPEEVRALVVEMSEWWKRFTEVPPAYAYLRSYPIEKDRLRRLRSEHKVYPTPIETFPAALQSLLIPAVTQWLNFHPLTPRQFNQLKAGMLAVTYKGLGYELYLVQSVNESEPMEKAKE